MPASFKVRTLPLEEEKFEEVLDPDFGESAIGRVAPVDSGQSVVSCFFSLHCYHYRLIKDCSVDSW